MEAGYRATYSNYVSVSPACRQQSTVAQFVMAVQIALDTNPLYTTRAGVARYVRGLQVGLRANNDPAFVVAPLAWEVENFSYVQPARAIKTAWRELVWARSTAQKQLRGTKADLLHSTALPLIEYPPCRHVVTLHDLALLRYPDRFRSWQKRSGLKRLKRIADADHIIAVSQFTADEAMELLQVPANKLSVVHHGVTLAEHEDMPAGLPDEFFLFVGSLEPGKNLSLLKQVWHQAQQNGASLPPLVIVGARWAGVATEGSPPADWYYLGYQSDEVLLALYRRARGLLFPSLYEGFGLPVLEAMAAGCPVICGRVASLPDAGGDAACYADLTIEGYLSAIDALMRDDEMREQLRQAGLDHARKFTWARCAQETSEVWRQTLGV